MRADLLRFVLLRGLGAVYLVAFAVWARQGPFLVGGDGLSPAHLYLDRVRASVPDGWLGALPTLFWLDDGDGALAAAGLVGMALSAAVLAGATNAVIMATLWALYVSIVNVGQDWYGYGWEALLCEAGFLAIFLCPLRTVSPRRLPSAQGAPVLLYRWLTFRLMLGAGLVKLRGDPCWQDLTCLVWHYETQPNPHPLSWVLHQLPPWVHAAGALLNHLVELVAPWFLFGPRALRRAAAVTTIAFQALLIASGNLAFFNWLTLVVALSALDDALLERLFPRLRAWLAPVPTRLGRAHAFVLAGLVLFVAWRSVPVVRNLVGVDGQQMNASYDPLHLVNTYGAFGVVGRTREEAVIQGTTGDPDDPAATWVDYELPCKPGAPARRPCLVTPYHLRLDWQMWFVPLQGIEEHAWLVHLLEKLLRGDPLALAQFTADPFPGGQPRAVRVARYRYRFTAPGEPGWWVRERTGNYVRALTLDDPALAEVMEQEGWW